MSFIYVRQNDGLPGLVQIGMTEDNPEVRASAERHHGRTGTFCRRTSVAAYSKDAAIYEAARHSFIDRVQNAIMWRMTWALMEIGVVAELTEQRHQPSWQILAHLIGVVGLYMVFKWPSAKQQAERDRSARAAHRRNSPPCR